MRLNLGCGFNKMDWYVNVDANPDCAPDEMANRDDLPWGLTIPLIRVL
jgi:hypothetical protein